MNNLIVSCGHQGCTKAAARKLAKRLDGHTDIVNARNFKRLPPLDYASYDNYIFGTNIRFGRLNRKFRKFARRLRRFYDGKPVFCYVCCANSTKAETYKRRATKCLGKRAVTVYAGGRLDEDSATGLLRQFLIWYGFHLAFFKRPLPYLRHATISELAAYINFPGREDEKPDDPCAGIFSTLPI